LCIVCSGYHPKWYFSRFLTTSAGNVALFESQAASYISSRGWNDVTKTANATGEYNCHSYAWYKSEGGNNNYWVNAFTTADLNNFNSSSSNATPPSPNNISRYWNDNSYVAVPASYATKAWYGSCWSWSSSTQSWVNECDHSAVRLSSGMLESKWGAWPRYQHSVDHSPYNSNNVTYYIRKPVISGTSTACIGSDLSFTYTNPSNAPLTWTCSSNIEYYNNVSGEGFHVRSNALSSWVALNLDGTEVARQTITVSGNLTASGPTTMNHYSTGNFTVNKSGSCLSSYNTYQWWITYDDDPYIYLVGTGSSLTLETVTSEPAYSPSAAPSFGSLDESVLDTDLTRLPPPSGGGHTYYLHARLITTGYNYAVSNTIEIATDVYLAPPISDLSPAYLLNTYPNPAGDILNVEITNNNTGLQTRRLQLSPTYTIRLYNQVGAAIVNTQSSDSKTTLNVSNIPSGIYFLYVSDGTDAKPTMKQVIISH